MIDKEPLTEEEMASIASADKNCRLVKGHVFLWKGAVDWHDLWDEDGILPQYELKGDTWVRKA